MVQQLSVGFALTVALVAAISDCRSGTIPNWLTLPIIAGSPAFYGATQGLETAIHSIAAVLLSAAVPFVLFRSGAMGGGDVKLLAALGAVMPLDLLFGLRVQIVAFAIGLLLALGSLARQGSLWSTTKSAFALSLNPLLPARFRPHVVQRSRCSVRLGFPILLGTVLALPPSLAFNGGLH
jgi:prepilin peptidase CpaA